ncbi:hypothetical protein QQS21_003585 [Conoideocrella luteorostrata]|uniref:Beta-galactosidase n=1 Tax=Conoideocrella luteorostrata TaxID=1105319 RepID=A0AAJ0CT41_9HYPO|nr:hypothetical protein QQS21_003585 [Conoideocrella luteorostrata]
MNIHCILSVCALALQILAAAAASFSYNNSHFLLDGHPLQILGGQIDPQRVPREYWEHRIVMAKAMGLNTIFYYVFWNEFQPAPDKFDFAGMNDIAYFHHLVQKHELHAVLRLGPYVCGEHEWGGFPSWLSTVPAMAVRQNNEPFFNAVDHYVARLAQELSPYLAKNGGPILMVQVENEYGSCGTDHNYTTALTAVINRHFNGTTLYTNNAGEKMYLQRGQVQGILEEPEGQDPRPWNAFNATRMWVNPDSQGPLMAAEYHIAYTDSWGTQKNHHTPTEKSIETIREDMEYLLVNNHSFNIYMFHGGTNWGFQNGASVSSTVLTPSTTSYDYGAPLDESGRTTPIYHILRDLISKRSAGKEVLPDIPAEAPMIPIPDFKLKPIGPLLNLLPPVHHQSKSPMNMEVFGQSTGFILYRSNVSTSYNGTLKAGDKPRDRIMVFINGKFNGIIDAAQQNPKPVQLQLKSRDRLDLLVENLGRVNWGCPTMFDQRKGIVGNVTVGGKIIQDWDIYPMPLANPPRGSASPDRAAGPVIYEGVFELAKTGDTFLELPGWTRGVVWVNGANLGRYWNVGPQQSLYLPGCYLRRGPNEIQILELESEPAQTSRTARGVTVRKWGRSVAM